jgi:hypothetical protein
LLTQCISNGGYVVLPQLTTPLASSQRGIPTVVRIRHYSYRKTLAKIKMQKTKAFFIIILVCFIVFFFSCKYLKKDKNKQIANQTKSQKTGVYLFNFKDESSETPQNFNCDTCLISTEYLLDTFIAQVLTPSNCKERLGSIKKEREALNLYYRTKYDKVDTIIRFNEDTKKIDTTIAISMSSKYGPSHCMNIITYKVIGLSEKPAVIKLNDQRLKDCQSKESFKIQKNDTINRTDWYGLRQGLWIERSKDGGEKNYYQNGFRQLRSEVIDDFGDTLIFYQLEGSMDVGLKFFKK